MCFVPPIAGRRAGSEWRAGDSGAGGRSSPSDKEGFGARDRCSGAGGGRTAPDAGAHCEGTDPRTGSKGLLGTGPARFGARTGLARWLPARFAHHHGRRGLLRPRPMVPGLSSSSMSSLWPGRCWCHVTKAPATRLRLECLPSRFVPASKSSPEVAANDVAKVGSSCLWVLRSQHLGVEAPT